MKLLVGLMLLAGSVLLAPCLRAQDAVLKAVVLEVQTGDRFTARLADGALAHVHLADVQAPELAQPAGNEATAALADLIGGRKVDLISRGHDRKGFLLAVVIIDKQDIAKRLVQDGWLWIDVATCRDRELLTDMVTAAANRRGLWLTVPAQPPWAYRAEKKIAD